MSPSLAGFVFGALQAWVVSVVDEMLMGDARGVERDNVCVCGQKQERCSTAKNLRERIYKSKKDQQLFRCGLTCWVSSSMRSPLSHFVLL